MGLLRRRSLCFGLPFYSDRFYLVSSEHDHLGADEPASTRADADVVHRQDDAMKRTTQRKKDRARDGGSNNATASGASSYDENHDSTGDHRRPLPRRSNREGDIEQQQNERLHHCHSHREDDHPLINVNRLVYTLLLNAATLATFWIGSGSWTVSDHCWSGVSPPWFCTARNGRSRFGRPNQRNRRWCGWRRRW